LFRDDNEIHIIGALGSKGKSSANGIVFSGGVRQALGRQKIVQQPKKTAQIVE
jgi:hypothetical protein